MSSQNNTSPIRAVDTVVGDTYYSIRGTAFTRVDDAANGAQRFQNVSTGALFTPEPRFHFYRTTEAAEAAREAVIGAAPVLGAAPQGTPQEPPGTPQGALFSEFDGIPDPVPAAARKSGRNKHTAGGGGEGEPAPTKPARVRRAKVVEPVEVKSVEVKSVEAPSPVSPVSPVPPAPTSCPYVASVEGSLGTHANASFNLGPKTLIIGPNDAGKDTLVRLITLPLDGSIDDAQGRGVVRTTSIIGDLVPHGADRIRADVEIMISLAGDGPEVDRASYALAPGKAADHVPPKIPVRFPLRAAVEELTGSPARARAWLLQHVAPRQTNDEIADALPEAALPAWDRLADPKRDGLVNLREIPKLAKARARDAKVAAETATASLQALRGTLDGKAAPTDADVAEARKRLEAAQDAKRQAEAAEVAAEAALTVARREVQAAYGAADAAYGMLPGRVLAAGSPRAALAMVEDAHAALQEKVEQAEAALTAARVQEVHVVRVLEAAQADLAAAKRKAGTFQADGDAIVAILARRVARGAPWTCPVCASETEHSCEAGEARMDQVQRVLAQRNGAVARAEDAVHVAEAAREEAEAVVRRADDDLAAQQQRLERASVAVRTVEAKIAADAARAQAGQDDDPVRVAEGAHRLADAGAVMAGAAAAEAQEDYDEILQRKGAAAQLSTLRDQRDAAEAAQGEYKALEDAAKKLLGRLVADAADAFVTRVQRHLPAGDRFFLDADDPALPFGFMRPDAMGTLRRETVLGGAAWDRALVAIAAATITSGSAEQEAPQVLNLIVPADRSRKPAVLGETLRAWAKIPAQVIVTTTTTPVWASPEDAAAWTVIQLAAGGADDHEPDPAWAGL